MSIYPTPCDPYPGSYSPDSLDPVLDNLIPKIPQLSQVQYDLDTQFWYLKQIAVKYGLYDAANYLQLIMDVK